MRKIIILLVFLLSSNIFAAKEEPFAGEKIKPIRIAFFINDESEAFGSDGSFSITREFARALSQQAFNMAIVSNCVLKNMILRTYTKNSDNIFTKMKSDFNVWDVYQIKDTQFFAFVSRDYDNPILNKKFCIKINLSTGKPYNGDGNECYPKISWADDAPIEVKRLLFNKNIKYIPYAEAANADLKKWELSKFPEHKKFDPIQLSLIFKLPVKEVKTLTIRGKPKEQTTANYELNSLPPCNIFIIGHGIYSPEEKSFIVAGMPSNDMVKTLLFFNDKLNTKSVRLSSCYSGGENLDLMRIKNGIPIRMRYIFIVDSLTDTEIISSMDPEDLEGTPFQEFAVGYSVDIKGYFDALESFQSGYTDFIDKLNVIRAKKKTATAAELKEIKSEIKELEKSSGLEQLLQKILVPIFWYFLPNGLSNFPQVWIPEVGWFQTFNIDPDVQKITDATIVRARENPPQVSNNKKPSKKNGFCRIWNN